MTSPVRFAFVVTWPAVKLAPVPVMLVPTSAEGVPSAGVMKVGDVVPAGPPVPLDAPPSNVATPVPSPDTPEAIGRPVPFVSVTEAGVPRTGATSVSVVPFVVAPVIPPKAPALLYWTWVVLPPGVPPPPDPQAAPAS